MYFLLFDLDIFGDVLSCNKCQYFTLALLSDSGKLYMSVAYILPSVVVLRPDLYYTIRKHFY